VPQEVEHAAVEDHLHGARPHHPQVLRRTGAPRQDHGPGGVELDLCGGLHTLEVCGGDRVERRVHAEEVRDLVHRPIEIYQY
jgi:hypothetical protein